MSASEPGGCAGTGTARDVTAVIGIASSRVVLAADRAA